jgi:hypothetical protein
MKQKCWITGMLRSVADISTIKTKSDNVQWIWEENNNNNNNRNTFWCHQIVQRGFKQMNSAYQAHIYTHTHTHTTSFWWGHCLAPVTRRELHRTTDARYKWHKHHIRTRNMVWKWYIFGRSMVFIRNKVKDFDPQRGQNSGNSIFAIQTELSYLTFHYAWRVCDTIL